MKYRNLGNTGIPVSEVGFGAWGIGGWGKRDDRQALLALERAFDLGINFYDTALGYGDGHSEALIGQTFKTRRHQVVIASKLPPKTSRWPVKDSDPLEETFPADWIIQCTEKSLKNLGSDYIDIQQLHAWTDAYTERDEWREAFLKLKEQGKIRAFGISANDWEPYNPVNLVRRGRIESVQVIYNIFEQRPAEQLLPAAIASGVGIIVRVPFEEGLLSGALYPGMSFDQGDWRADWATPERLEEAGRRVEALKAFLDDNTPTLASLALKFILGHPAVSTVIPGMRRVKHVEINAAVPDSQPLSVERLKALEAHKFIHGWLYPWSA
jgi:aryl-alcohol dehydrogenase-like predicted oxidoreductase